MRRFLEKHPVASAVVGILIFVFWSFPQWFGSIWPLLSDKTVPQWLAQKSWGMSSGATAWVALVVGILLGALSFDVIYRARRSSGTGARAGLPAFEDREQLSSRRGSLQHELAMVRNGWIIWPVGGTSGALANETLANIERLILRHPHEDSDLYATHFGPGSSSVVSSIIADLTVRAQKLGISVRWSSDFDLSMIISDRANDDAWARIELLLPGIDSAYRPSILVMKTDRPRIFQTLVKTYEHMWGQSIEVPRRPALVGSADRSSPAEFRGDILGEERGEIRFDYPPGPLERGWKCTLDPHEKTAPKFSPVPEYPGGISVAAPSSTHIDHDVEASQRACNGLRFDAKIAEGSHVYARMQLISRDRPGASKPVWIAFAVGRRPGEMRPADEWVIYREPQRDGWARFNISLLEEVERSPFGQAQGLTFCELLSLRIRGSVSLSPIQLYRVAL